MKETLNLTQTSFPMRADLPKLEPKIIQRMQDHHVYKRLRAMRNGAPKFILNDGPPYANGPIHLGHATNKILKDIIIRSKTLSGFDCPYIPGWDCHGLPIEVQVEKQIGKKGDSDSFRALCRQYAASQIAIQKEGFQRLGILGEWEHPYTTMSPDFEAQIIRQIASFIQKNAIQPGFKPVHWCPLCGSSLSEAETEFVNKVSHSLDVVFHVTETLSCQGKEYPLHVVAWTTTPWTLPSNQAIAYHPDLEYVALIYDHKAYLVYRDKIEECLSLWGWDSASVQVVTLDPDFLEGKTCFHLFDPAKKVPFLPSDHVTTEKGTGLVHTAPDHGPEDYLLGMRFGLKPLEYLDLYGRFQEDACCGLKGISWTAAETIIIAILKEKGQLLRQDTIEHQYLTCWRHKKPIFYRATAQWFVAFTQPYRDAIMNTLSQVQWHPDSGEARMYNMIATRPDWCISRQRFWGTPLVLVFHQKTRELHPNILSIIETVATHVEKEGLEAWYTLSLEDLGVNPDEGWVKSSDTLDVWFDSGCVFHILNKDPALHFPADLYLEGNDQYRGWFQSSLICSVAHTDQAPYKAVLTHGFLVDPQGKKMSKSLGNVVDPKDVADKYGIDILRLWVSMTNYEEEMAIAPTILDRVADSYRRIRNTLKFILANLVDFQASEAIALDQLPLLDRWILSRTFDLQKNNQNAYDQYDFSAVSRSLMDFCVNDLGAVYLDIIKDRLYTCGKNSHARKSAQTTLNLLFQSLVHQLSPILVFTTEEAWSHYTGRDDDFLSWHVWPQIHTNLMTADNMQAADRLLALRKKLQLQLEELRQNGQIGSSLEAQIHFVCPRQDPLWQIKDELKFIFLVSHVTLEEGPSEQISVAPYEGIKCPRCWHRVPILGQECCSRCELNVHGEGEKRDYA